jgi:hypothetical protein
MHDEVWLPPLKEIHYFDSIDPTVAYRKVHQLPYRIRSQLSRRALHYLAAMLGSVAGSYSKRAKPDIEWDKRYFSPGGSIDWYRSLFESKLSSHKVVGEITPSYQILSRPIIQRIRNHTSVDRLILMLRDPVEATWSSFGRKVRDGKILIEEGNSQQILEELLGPSIRDRFYARNLSCWLEEFPREQIFIGYYEDLISHPGKLLDDICYFLGVHPISESLGSALNERVNSSRDSRGNMPPEIELALSKCLEGDLSELRMCLGGHVTRWHERASSVIALSGNR